MHERKTGGKGKAKSGSRAATTPRPAPAHRPGDNLTVISGIGLGRQQILNRIGIHTFADLAKCDPERIRHALGPSAHLVNVDGWVQEAKRLT
jgi:predicted flap endonuclease-1-like 5' DNA nuclease